MVSSAAQANTAEEFNIEALVVDIAVSLEAAVVVGSVGVNKAVAVAILVNLVNVVGTKVVVGAA